MEALRLSIRQDLGVPMRKCGIDMIAINLTGNQHIDILP